MLTEMDDGTLMAQTLGVKPLPDVIQGIREGSASRSLCKGKTYTSSKMLMKQGSTQAEIKATVGSASGAVGLIVAASPDMSEYTTITYQPSNNTLLVDRSHSTRLKKQYNLETNTGYFMPYTLMSGGTAMVEPITMDVFVDGSLLEVYVNDRFALTTRIYPSMECSTGYGVYVEPGSSAMFESVQAWENLKNVWPNRPADSSSQLVFDTAAETNDYVWWPGN